MFVVKRDGRQEPVQFDKIIARVRALSYGLSPLVDPVVVGQKTVQGVRGGIRTEELDMLASEIAAGMVLDHPDFSILAGRIQVSNLHKKTTNCFSEVVQMLSKYTNEQVGQEIQGLAPDFVQFVQEHKDVLNSAIIYERDYKFDFFGFKTLERSYLLRINGDIVERPQHMFMRVACQLNMSPPDPERAIETYNYLSNHQMIHATPTLFNSGTPNPQLSSCFLLDMKSDSISGIYDTLKQCALISQFAGGIGLSISKIRATGSFIAGTGGYSNGIIPMARVFNATARYVDQGGGKRKGSFALYLEPHHPDLMDFLDLRKNNGIEELRARDLFLALWISDLFMERVESGADWSFFCPHECPGLEEVYGEEYTKLYTSYEEKDRAKKTLPARTVWNAILAAQVETGTPYMLFKNACNSKSNQKHLGPIHGSNLCTEIVEYTSPDEVAVCNLASVSLPACVVDGKFQFSLLESVTEHAIENLNRVIDVNFYPVPEAKHSNMRHRPVGLGIQGLATTFFKLGIAYDSKEAQQLNRDIMETIYYVAIRTSMRLAQRDGPYETFQGSPISQGLFQFDLWDCDPGVSRYDWTSLRRDVQTHGIRNSLLLALMPTASTSQMFGNSPSWEPQMSNMFTRRTLSGDFVVANRFLVEDLLKLGLWTTEMKFSIMRHRGSVQAIENIPPEIRARYKTAFEISGKVQCDMSRDRARFVCQSESFNAFMTDTTRLTSRHFYAWRLGLKTGLYYLRTVAAADAIQFTVPVKEKEPDAHEASADVVCDPECLSCGA